MQKHGINETCVITENCSGFRVSAFLRNCHEGWGEDMLLSDGRTGRFAVLDGATCIDQLETCGFHSQAEWMMHDFSDYFYTERGVEALSFLQTVSRYCLTREPDFIKVLEEYDKPCFAAASAYFRYDEVCFAPIADCSSFILFKDGRLTELSDSSVEAFSEMTRAAKAAARAAGEDPEEASRRQRIENKKMMNRPGGYRAGAFGADSRDLPEYCFNAEEIEAFMLCSDGFRRVLELPEISIEDILSGAMPPEEAADRLFAYENGQSSDWQVKRHDDMSAIIFQRSGRTM